MVSSIHRVVSLSLGDTIIPILCLLLYSYEIMMSCWNEDRHKRPRFSKLVNTFSDLLESDAGYLQLSQLPISEEKGHPQKPPAASGQPIMTMKEDVEVIELDKMSTPSTAFTSMAETTA